MHLVLVSLKYSNAIRHKVVVCKVKMKVQYMAMGFASPVRPQAHYGSEMHRVQ